MPRSRSRVKPTLPAGTSRGLARFPSKSGVPPFIRSISEEILGETRCRPLPRPARPLALAVSALALLAASAGAGSVPDPDPAADAEPSSEHSVSPSPDLPDELVDRARQVLRRVPLVDGHNDLPWQLRRRVDNHLERIDLTESTADLDPPLHTDIPRLREGGVGAQFWSVFIPTTEAGPGAAATVIEQIDVVHRMAERYPDTFEVAYGADDVRRIFAEGKIASLIGIEGGHSIESSLAVLRQLHRAGARYMTLTHGENTAWADSATDTPEHGGLTEFGREVVREMNRLGMLVDLSHVSGETMHDALDTTDAPVIFSHSSARALTAHPRNVPDDVLERLRDDGGVVMVTFVQPFVSEELRQWYAAREAEEARLASLHPGEPETVEEGVERWEETHARPRTTLSQVADHIDHVRDVAGIDHVGIGSDFDGIPSGPEGLEDVSDFPLLFAELLRRGYSEEELEKIAGLNLLRVFDRAEEVAAELRAARPASDALIGELDGDRDGTAGDDRGSGR